MMVRKYYGQPMLAKVLTDRLLRTAKSICLTGMIQQVISCGVLILTMERNYGATVMMHQDQFHIRGNEVFLLSMATGSIPAVLTETCTALIPTHIYRYGTRTS